MDKDEIADDLFGVPYKDLSVWGKRSVITAWHKLNRVDAPYASTLHDEEDPATLSRENERLARDLESARIENLELWDENSELKAQLIELQVQFNLKDSSS